MTKSRSLVLLVLLLAMSVSFIRCEADRAQGEETVQQVSNAKEKAEVETANAVLVETVTISPRRMNSFLLLTSTLETENMVDVYPRIQGNITELLVEEGRIVKQGDPLVQLDDREQTLEVQKAEILFKQKEQIYLRNKESYEKKVISKVDMDNAEFDMQSAEIAWEQAKQNLSYTSVTAPISGVVAERLIRNGDKVDPSARLFKIVDNSEKIAQVFVPEREISSLKKGQNAIIKSEFLNEVDFKGKIKRISPVVDPNSGTFKVTVALFDPKNRLRPGMFISVRIITAVKDNVIAVPKDAIVYDSGLPFVFVVKNNVAKKIPLKQGFSDEQYVESITGLTLGDTIITVGQSGLKDNTPVRIISLPE
ncbi:MAG: efflux RND transporter periplasmic adaptor subunit [bacterium]|nr:efflux RND transporter periplasmic adaptor subunit [bacterium]